MFLTHISPLTVKKQTLVALSLARLRAGAYSRSFLALSSVSKEVTQCYEQGCQMCTRKKSYVRTALGTCLKFPIINS
jgi:hypothetical protein